MVQKEAEYLLTNVVRVIDGDVEHILPPSQAALFELVDHRVEGPSLQPFQQRRVEEENKRVNAGQPKQVKVVFGALISRGGE
jgi:hypothetical protein